MKFGVVLHSFICSFANILIILSRRYQVHQNIFSILSPPRFNPIALIVSPNLDFLGGPAQQGRTTNHQPFLCGNLTTWSPPITTTISVALLTH